MSGFACGGGACRVLDVDCRQCDGYGKIHRAMLRWIERGRYLRDQRLLRGTGLRAEAVRLGVSSVWLSDIEQGRIDNSEFQ